MLAVTAFAGSASGDSGDDQTVRWDIVNIFGTDPPAAAAGGTAEALANDDSKITITGTGTFDSELEHATGGGTWETRGASGALTGSGTYQVRKALYFVQAPGTFPLGDTIGDPSEAGPGLAYLRIRYSDGAKGILIVSCRLAGTPPSVFEGINASKDFVDYTHNIEPVSGAEGNRTLFHVTEEEEGEED